MVEPATPIDFSCEDTAGTSEEALNQCPASSLDLESDGEIEDGEDVGPFLHIGEESSGKDSKTPTPPTSGDDRYSTHFNFERCFRVNNDYSDFGRNLKRSRDGQRFCRKEEDFNRKANPINSHTVVQRVTTFLAEEKRLHEFDESTLRKYIFRLNDLLNEETEIVNRRKELMLELDDMYTTNDRQIKNALDTSTDPQVAVQKFKYECFLKAFREQKEYRKKGIAVPPELQRIFLVPPPIDFTVYPPPSNYSYRMAAGVDSQKRPMSNFWNGETQRMPQKICSPVITGNRRFLAPPPRHLIRSITPLDSNSVKPAFKNVRRKRLKHHRIEAF